MSAVIPLSTIDHIFTGVGSYPIEFIFNYNGFLDEDTLRASLEKTIKYFPVISSRLVKLSEESYGFELSPKGTVFDVVQSDINFEENEKKYIYINPVETLEGNPLTKIRITHTPIGSVLGVSISHSIADGFSYFHFLSSWARIFHNKQFFPPVHDRKLLIADPDQDNFDSSELGVLNGSGLFLDEKRMIIAKEELQWKSRIFTTDELKELLSGAQNESDIRLSFNDIVTAQLSKEFLLKWDITDGHEPFYISCPVDFRRLREGFPKTYFGNAVALTTTSIEYQDLQKISLADLALKIRSNVRKADDTYINRSIGTLSTLQAQQKRKIFERIHVMHPRSGLLVTNLSRLPVHEIAFNAGPPINYSILTQTVRGAVILPHNQGLEARVCCPVGK